MHRTWLDGGLLGQVHIQDAVAVHRADFFGVDPASDTEVSVVVADAVFLMDSSAERRVPIQHQACDLQHVSIDDEFDVI